jgi:hypothetical protein
LIDFSPSKYATHVLCHVVQGVEAAIVLLVLAVAESP